MREKAADALSYDTFKLHKRIVVKDMPFFNKVGMDYFFKNNDPSTIIFAKADCVFSMNIESEKI